MTDDTPRGTRSRLGPDADEGMPEESNHPEARRKIVDEATADTAERDQNDEDDKSEDS